MRQNKKFTKNPLKLIFNPLAQDAHTHTHVAAAVVSPNRNLRFTGSLIIFKRMDIGQWCVRVQVWQRETAGGIATIHDIHLFPSYTGILKKNILNDILFFFGKSEVCCSCCPSTSRYEIRITALSVHISLDPHSNWITDNNVVVVYNYKMLHEWSANRGQHVSAASYVLCALCTQNYKYLPIDAYVKHMNQCAMLCSFNVFALHWRNIKYLRSTCSRTNKCRSLYYEIFIIFST